MKLLVAAVHESGSGTFETCRPTLTMSVSGGRPEVVGRRPNDAIDPTLTFLHDGARGGAAALGLSRSVVKKFESFEGPSLTLPNTCVRFPRSPEALAWGLGGE